MKFILSFIIIFVLFALSQSVVLDCEFVDDEKDGYTCIVQNPKLITLRNNQRIENVEGQHIDGRSNFEVKTFVSFEKEIWFFPRDLASNFYYMEKIQITGGFLKE